MEERAPSSDDASPAAAERDAHEVRLPRWRRVALLVVLLDLVVLGVALALARQPSAEHVRVLGWLVLLAGIAYVGFLLQVFAWVVVIAFFARARAREGLVPAALLGLETACVLVLLALLERARSSAG